MKIRRGVKWIFLGKAENLKSRKEIDRQTDRWIYTFGGGSGKVVTKTLPNPDIEDPPMNSVPDLILMRNNYIGIYELLQHILLVRCLLYKYLTTYFLVLILIPI